MIDSLPNRPLKPPEVDEVEALVDSGEVSPLTTMKVFPDDTLAPFDEIDEAGDFLHVYEALRVYSLFSEEDGEWVQAIEMTAEYNEDELETRTHEFVQEHMSIDIDTDFNPVPVTSESSDGDNNADT
jgi:hypothetical protein